MNRLTEVPPIIGIQNVVMGNTAMLLFGLSPTAPVPTTQALLYDLKVQSDG
jgi:hypothetical protein